MHDPAVETLPWDEQVEADHVLYRAQVRYLFEHSDFHRKKLVAAGFGDPAGVGGLRDIGALPMTEKDEFRASRTPDHPVGTHLAAPMSDVVRVDSTSGTTAVPTTC